MKNKSNTQAIIQSFFSFVETQFHVKIKSLRFDNGLEFHMPQFSLPKAPYISWVVLIHLNKIQFLKGSINIYSVLPRPFVFQANLPLRFWGDCILTTVYLINRLPSPLLQNKTPYKVLLGTIPPYSHLRVLGCLCFASTLSRNRSKFYARASSCVFLGYPYGVKGYKLLNLETKSIFLSKDVMDRSSFCSRSLSSCLLCLCSRQVDPREDPIEPLLA